MQFGLCCLLAPGLFAEHRAAGHGGAGGGTPRHDAGHGHASIQTFGRRDGYGYGGYYNPFYDYGDYGYAPTTDAAGSNLTVVYPPAAPAVTIVQTAHPVIHEYTQPEDYGTAADRDSHPILYLIAFRDSTIRAAMTYWVEGGALHYLDKGHQEKQARSPRSTAN
jgi:hypothetical protein